jgi:importin-5
MPCLGCESSIFVALPRMNWSPQAFRIEATAKAAFHGLSALHPEPLALRLASSLAAPAKPVELHGGGATTQGPVPGSPPPASDSSNSAAATPLWP